MRQDHPTVRRRLTREQSLELGHIHVSSRRRGLGLVDQHLYQLGFERNVQLRLQHYLVVPEIVRRTDLALTVSNQWAKRAGLKVLPLPFELPPVESHLLWHSSADGDRANRWLRERIVGLCA